MQYPVTLSFKKFAISPQIFVRDAGGTDVAYVKQKLFKLKEHIEVFADRSKAQLLYEIRANKVLDFSAGYLFTDGNGQSLGAVRRKGARSIWKAHYEIADDAKSEAQMTINEENGWIKFLDSILSDVPVVGLFMGYFLNPTYLITRAGAAVARVRKRPSFLESEFVVEEIEDLAPHEETRVVLSVLMMVLLERRRG